MYTALARGSNSTTAALNSEGGDITITMATYCSIVFVDVAHTAHSAPSLEHPQFPSACGLANALHASRFKLFCVISLTDKTLKAPFL